MRLLRTVAGRLSLPLLGLTTALLLALAGFQLASSGDRGSPVPYPAVASAAEAGDPVAGERVYVTRCSPCHGLQGDGNGPVAQYLTPRPRDFTRGIFKLRSTSTGEPPLDSDLIQTVKKGVSGTAMPAWEGTLGEEEIGNVLAYIKTFAPDRFVPQLSPQVVEIGRRPAVTADLIARGKELYDQVECWQCHGAQGRADGPSAPTLEDDWGFLIRPRNLTKAWQFKRGTSTEDIYLRLSTGMDGTPMPSFLFDLSEAERWAVAAYVASLVGKTPDASQAVLRSKLIDGDLPTMADDPRWARAQPLQVAMTGQVVAAPRWQNPSVDLLTVRSLHNGTEVAFLLAWDDPRKDTVHRVGAADDRGLGGTYANWEVYGPRAENENRRLPSYRDAIALQLPKKIPDGPRKPHFLWGRANDPVNLWMWKADLQEERGDAATAVEEMIARGHLVDKETLEKGTSTLTELMERLLTLKPPERQTVWGRGAWNDGRWQVVMTRALDTGDTDEIRLETGRLTPVAFQAWDGSNGERGLMMAISSWQFLLLETPTPVNVYLFTLAGALVSGALEVWIVRRLRRASRADSGSPV